MTLQDLREHYTVDNYKNKPGVYTLCSKEVDITSRLCHKYFCQINYNNRKQEAWVNGFEPTNKIEELKKQVESYITSLPYDSEYYYPHWRKGMFVELIVDGYLRGLGFKNLGSSYGDLWEFNGKNCYGKSISKILLTTHGVVDEYDFKKEKFENSEEVTLNLNFDDYSWVSCKCKRDVEEIKKSIDSLLKPLMLSESANMFSVGNLMVNADGTVALNMNNLTGTLKINSQEFNVKLKENLLALAATL